MKGIITFSILLKFEKFAYNHENAPIDLSKGHNSYNLHLFLYNNLFSTLRMSPFHNIYYILNPPPKGGGRVSPTGPESTCISAVSLCHFSRENFFLRPESYFPLHFERNDCVQIFRIILFTNHKHGLE